MKRLKASEAEDVSALESIRGYLVGVDGRPESECPHLDGGLRAAWLEGWKSGRKALEEWRAE